MLTLRFDKSYLSITAFPDCQLPSLTIITGPNGAGKTHLLQALTKGHIKASIDGAEVATSGIKMFDWQTLLPQESKDVGSQDITNDMQDLYELYHDASSNEKYLERVRNIIRDRKLPEKYLQRPVLLVGESEQVKDLLGEDQYREFLLQVQPQFDAADSALLQKIPQEHRRSILEIAKHNDVPVFCLSREDFLQKPGPKWGHSNLFQQAFGRLFVSYRDLLLRNQLAQFRASKGNNEPYLTDAEFIQKYGPAPWDFVNESFLHGKLDFSVNQPVLDAYEPFTCQVVKRSTGAPVPFSALSSGEKVLMSFAFCAYYSLDRRQLAVLPELLLLDEVDAPLHPSMAKSVIHTIADVLVDKFKINVIATTHSPTTVALAPEESIHVIESGNTGLRKASKATALNLLTVGVPTISISFDGRRQVFVESPTDAKNFDSLYRLVKHKLNSERSLEFLATGTRSKEGDTNTGCDIVIKLVEGLTESGNSSVFGLIDWDGKNYPRNRVFVLSYQKRDGLENVILDPLLVGLAIWRDCPQNVPELGLPLYLSYPQLCSAGADKWQSLVEAVGMKVFGKPDAPLEEVEYTGGSKLLVDRRFLLTDDHLLEEKVLAAMPFLHRLAKRQRGVLVEHLIATVLNDNPELIPKDVVDDFSALLQYPSV